jgi:hypothetical protein
VRAPHRIGRLTVALAVVACASLLASCGGGGGSDGSDDGGTTTAASGGGGGGGGPTTTYSVPSGSTGGGTKGGRVRLLNAFEQDGKAGPTMDVYDTPTPSAEDEPLIAGLAYGDLSPYVEPAGRYGGAGNLYLFPRGDRTPSSQGGEPWAGQGVSNAGFDAGTQQTVVVGSDKSFEDEEATVPIYTEIDEIGSEQYPIPESWRPIAGKGLVLANSSGMGSHADFLLTTYLGIDGACPKRLDPENSAGAGGEAPEPIANGNAVPFEVAPGHHTVQILATPTENGPAQCDPAAVASQAGFVVGGGKRVEVFVFGPTQEQRSVNVLVAEVPD